MGEKSFFCANKKARIINSTYANISALVKPYQHISITNTPRCCMNIHSLIPVDIGNLLDFRC